MQQIKVQGMHCDACKILVTMELEENQLDQYISDIVLTNNNIGILHLKKVDEETIAQIISVINNLSDYQALTN